MIVIYLPKFFLQRYPLQSLLSVILIVIGNEPQIYKILENKSHLEHI